MERFEVGYVLNRLFSCREKAVRFQHHVTLLGCYRTCKCIPRGFLLKFHSGVADSVITSRVNSTLRKCSVKLMGLFEVYYKHKSLRLVKKNGNSRKLLRDFILKRPITFCLSWKSGRVN